MQMRGRIVPFIVGLLSNKKGMASLRKTIQSLPKEDQDKGFDMLQEAERILVTIGAPSQLGVGLLLGAIGATGVTEESRVYWEAASCALMGYACRMAQDGEVPVEMADKIEAALSRSATGDVDLEAMGHESGALGRLLERVAAFADEPRVIAYLAGCSMSAWTAFSAGATFQLHRNLVKNGLKRALLLPEEGIENLLRLGYVVRVVDEVACLDPAPAIAATSRLR
jgi:hypothetical protein